jgi:hypothetical protein
LISGVPERHTARRVAGTSVAGLSFMVRIAWIVVGVVACKGDPGSTDPPPVIPTVALPIAGVVARPPSRDETLARAVRERLLRDPALTDDEPNVTIHVRRGTVILCGKVATETSKAAVGRAAADIVGPEDVINQLDVTP